MKLWLLRPVTGDEEVGPWDPWYDKKFGFVVRAESEEAARRLADENAGIEAREINDVTHPWLDKKYSICELLKPEGKPSIVMEDFRRG